MGISHDSYKRCFCTNIKHLLRSLKGNKAREKKESDQASRHARKELTIRSLYIQLNVSQLWKEHAMCRPADLCQGFFVFQLPGIERTFRLIKRSHQQANIRICYRG